MLTPQEHRALERQFSTRKVSKQLGISNVYLHYMITGKRPWRPDLKEEYDRITAGPSKTSYKQLTFKEKVNYQSSVAAGFVYHPHSRISRQGKRVYSSPDHWCIEWPSGNRKPSGRTQYRKLNVRGTEAQARALLNIINQVAHRTVNEANEAIEPYVSWHNIPKSGTRIRVISGHVPHVVNTYQMQKRNSVILDYHRIKLLDTLAKLCRELGNYECEGDGVGMEATALWT